MERSLSKVGSSLLNNADILHRPFGSKTHTHTHKDTHTPLHMIWASRRYHMEGYMTPIAGMLLPSMGYLRVLLVWFSIQRPHKSVILRIRRDKKQRNMIPQIA